MGKLDETPGSQSDPADTVQNPMLSDATDSEETLAAPTTDADAAADATLESDIRLRGGGEQSPDESSEVSRPREADADQTIVQGDFSQTLDEVAKTLATEHQDLDRTLPQTSLRPGSSATGLGTQSVSVRPRGIGSATEMSSAGIRESDDGPDYLTMQMLGQGGMGTVHLARQVALGRSVALKQIQPKHRRQQSVKDEFLTEAVLTGKLEHPNIVPIYEVGSSSNGDLFYSMKNIKGQAWDESIGTLSLDENLDILINVCDAIAFAHAEGVIHRDLKPQNIMTGGFGEVLVLDWGLAVLTGPDGEFTGSAAGTPAYMAPEMINPPFRVGQQSDVYLLGAMLFKVLTGAAPHAGKSARDSLEAASKNEIVNPNEDRVQELDPSGELLGIALRAMATKPEDRFQTAPDFQQAIRGFLSHRESLELSSRAQRSLDLASLTGDYTQYSRATFGFEEALKLWDGNVAAVDGGAAARLAWALSAESQSDFDLALSLLDGATSDQQEIRARVTAARDRRDAREQHVRRLRRISQVTSLAVAVVASVAAVWIYSEHSKAEIERANAVAAQMDESRQRGIAESETKRANRKAAEADEERNKATASAALAEKRRITAEENLRLADRRHYCSDMNLAQLNWESNNIRLVLDRLDRHAPSPETRSDEVDVRGFEWFYWHRQCHRDLLTLKGHTAAVWGVAFSPDGTRIASASADHTVKLWNAATGEEIATLEGHTKWVNDVVFSPTGARIASAGTDSTVKLWDAATGQETATLEGHAGGVRSVAFSPDGARIASAGDDRTVKLWDTATGQEAATLRGHTGVVGCVAFSPDGARIASGSGVFRKPSEVKLWDTATRQVTATLKGHADVVTNVAFSPNSERLVSTSLDGIVKLWDVATGQETATLQGHTSSVSGVAFSPNGTQVVSASGDKTVKLWDVATGQETATLKGHAGEGLCVSFSPDGTRIASAGTDNSVKVWNAVTGEETATPKQHKSVVYGVTFSPDGSQIAWASGDSTVRLWDTVTQLETATLRGHTGIVWSAAFSPDGDHLASAASDKTVKLWDVVTGKEAATLNGHSGVVYGVTFSLDGTLLASASDDTTVKLWDVATHKEVATLRGHTKWVTEVAFSRDGTCIASASGDGTVKLWDVATGQETATLKGHSGVVSSVALSEDGELIASGGRDNTVKLWSRATSQETATLKGHTHWVESVAFSPDGTRIVSASTDNTLKLWDSVTGQETATLKGHTGAVYSVAFSPGGKQLASVSFDKSVRLWDARPWSPQMRSQFQARGYLTVHCDRAETLEGLQAQIRSDRTITDRVRQQALELAEPIWISSQKTKRHDLAIQYDGEGNAHLLAGQVQDALDAYTQALEIRKKLADADTTDAQSQRNLMLSHFKLGQAQRNQFAYAEAGQHFQAGVEVLDRMIEWGLNVESSRAERAILLAQIESTRLAREATGNWDTVLEQASKNPVLLYYRTAELAKQKNFDEAAQSASKHREFSQSATDDKADQLYNSACAYGLCAAAVQPAAGESLTEELQTRRKQFLELSLTCLTEAIAAGFKNFEHARKDPDLSALRDLPEFQNLVKEPEKAK